ncbi:hypothetical protein TrLO_g12325 [Triparma laevis f. longispina]|uniref:Uncharacterized protein n=1 Tax=Triparma laevis f. longispina TaxID=1714387 RepID=A0A9W7FMT2_9STRA|nr:hypothetical protein TrLO_g12325 [Triparma laevis f. longispina]
MSARSFAAAASATRRQEIKYKALGVDPEGGGIDRTVASVFAGLAGETLDGDGSIASEVLREALSGRLGESTSEEEK